MELSYLEALNFESFVSSEDFENKMASVCEQIANGGSEFEIPT